MPRNTAPDACAGFEELELRPQPVDVLNGRLRITPLSGFEGEVEDIWVEPLRPPTGVRWQTPSSVLEQRLKFRRGARELEIYTRDLLALAPDNPAATLHRSPEVAGLTVEDLKLDNGARLVLATPDELDVREGRAVLAFAHSVLPDNTLQVTYVTVNAAVVDAGAAGCQALARKLLLSLSPGAQRWERRRRVVELFDMTLAVPQSYAFVRQWVRHGYWDHWDEWVFRVLKFSPLLGPSPELAVTNISTGPFVRDPAASRIPGLLLGKPVVWFETRAPGRIFREALLERTDGASLRLFLTAENDVQASELTRVASSLRWVPPAL